MAPNPQENWPREFKELGAERVRSGLISGHWDREKRAAARQWLEQAGARAWRQTRGDKPPSESGSFIVRLRNATWWRYATTAIFILMGLGFLLRRFR